MVDNIPFSVIPQYKNLAFLRTKYLEERLSIQEIATQISSSKEAVRQGLIAAGVILREPSKPHGRPSQPKFGSRLKKGRETLCHPEQKLIDVIKGLRSQNMSYRQIAQTLSKLGVPTKCDRKYWHPEMVRRVFSANASPLGKSEMHHQPKNDNI